MPYTTPTAAAFKVRYPAFDAVADATIEAALAEAAGRVDTSWVEADYQPALMAYAAHLLTLDGMGSSTEAQLSGIRSLSVGSLSITRAIADSASGASITSTSYGLRYLELLQANRGGPRVAQAAQ